ncbi:MAG TPA: AAA family ATPase [Micromonosporaceae bacterium]|nr:AAA family ATPase [Micromonosporaceae bacterium]
MTPGNMVGRADQLAELTRAWAAVDGPATTRTVVVTGAGGVGKSMLVAAALAAFAPRPRAVLAGTARIHSPAPYDWLAAVLAGRGTAGLPVPAPALAWLAQHPDAPRERYAPGALLRLAVRTVRAMIDAGPVALVVEDLHALDPASLNLVGELAATTDLGALLLVTSRPPDEAVSPALVARTLARLSGTPGATRQHLGPLAPADVDALLARAYPGVAVPPEVAATVRRRTGGNPYWIRELMATAGGGDPAALARTPLPRHLGLDTAPDAAGADGSADGSADGGAYGGAYGGEADLTAREVEVLHCLTAGMSNKQIARSLGISIRTVTVHVSNLLRKTRSASRTEAALWAVQRQLVPR